MRINIVGNIYGRLSVLKEVEPICLPSGKPVRMFECLCECGRIKQIRIGSLRKGQTKSCGCLRDEAFNKTNRNLKHGYHNTGTYSSWLSMKKRCLNPKEDSYQYYGGRGITICERWLDFESFLEDMGERPIGKTLDRIKVNGNYEPGNCRWATNIEQQNNKRNSKSRFKSNIPHETDAETQGN